MRKSSKNNNITPKLGRNADGTYAKGHTVSNRPYARYAETIRVLNGKYNAKEIIELAANPKMLEVVNPLEAMAIKQMARSLTDIAPENANEVRQEREALLDRVEGKAAQPIEHTGTVGTYDLSQEELDERMDAIVRHRLKHQPKES